MSISARFQYCSTPNKIRNAIASTIDAEFLPASIRGDQWTRTGSGCLAFLLTAPKRHHSGGIQHGVSTGKQLLPVFGADADAADIHQQPLAVRPEPRAAELRETQDAEPGYGTGQC
jgi:hypothetical protein